jgi:hypothetical protein
MSDNLKRYLAIKQALRQLYPKEPQGRLAQSLNVLAMLSTALWPVEHHLRQVAKKTPVAAKVSNARQLSRWYQNERVTYELHMLPFIRPCLPSWPSRL